MATSRSGAAHQESASAGPLLDARAAAEHLGISVAMLRSATAAGEIAHVRLRCRGSGARNAVRWLVADLDGWVLTHRVPAAPDRGRAGRGPIQRHSEPTTSARMVGARGRGAPLLSAREVLRRDGAA